jgi:hypothetical protein
MTGFNTNFYGFIGLASTIGKHASNVGAKVNSFNKNYTYHYAQQASDKFWATLKGASEHGERFSKWTKTKFQEGETWANEKAEQAKREEDWRKVNEKYAHVERDSKTRGVRINLEEDIIECMILRPKKTTYLPSCLRSWRV